MSEWIPGPFDLLEGNPFEYAEDATSSTSLSGTEAFETGIEKRDGNFCVVCGFSDPQALDYCHIIPKVEDETWEEMKTSGLVPQYAKGVAHDARNGIRLCANHSLLFEMHSYYIRWMPEERCFVFINHSQKRHLEVYHGKAITLNASDDRLPFHGAFLIHEMRVRGYWPLRKDRAITLPMSSVMVDWLHPRGCGGQGDRGGVIVRGSNSHNNETSGVPGSSASGKVFIPTDPFTNPASLEALKQSFAEQPNWKATVIESTTWEGNAD